MATFVRLSADLPAVNMDHVQWVERGLVEGQVEGQVIVTMYDGRSSVLTGDQAERILIWLRNNAGLPIVQRQPGGHE